MTVLDAVADRVSHAAWRARPEVVGRVAQVVGLAVEVEGLEAAVGDAVRIEVGGTGLLVCEVVAVRDGGLVCLPFGELRGVRAGARAVAEHRPVGMVVGPALLGRVLDGLGRPIDGGPPLQGQVVDAAGSPPNPLLRAPVDEPLPLGVRVLDTLLPCGRGQRMAIMAGSGVGKSTLLSMIARGSEAEVSVVCLVGERGREVREFLDRDLGAAGMARSVVVVATSDEPALVRLRAVATATRIAESFRDEGSDVVLMVDSLTRFAMAQREVGLSAGEPPATRGYPPSVFSLLPRLLERAGPGETGSITGLYTVLVEGDDMNEPIGDAVRSILDGHIVLSRSMAAAGHFPCVDVLQSVSRVAPAITDADQRALSTELRRLLAARAGAKDLVDIGAYVHGADHDVDRALALSHHMDLFLRQDADTSSPADVSWAALRALLGIAA